MISKRFEDEKGRTWVVIKRGSYLKVVGESIADEPLYEIARSCARKMGIYETEAGVPIQYVNEHGRIWRSIWMMGKDNDISPQTPSPKI